jgi:hypothetical protein
MKRSEAIDLILHTVNSIIESDSLMTEDAEYVLKKLEDAGMKPPFNAQRYYHTWRDGGEGYEWEEE